VERKKSSDRFWEEVKLGWIKNSLHDLSGEKRRSRKRNPRLTIGKGQGLWGGARHRIPHFARDQIDFDGYDEDFCRIVEGEKKTKERG